VGLRWEGNPGDTGERKERGWPGVSRVGVAGMPGLEGGWKTGWGERPGLWPAPEKVGEAWDEFEVAAWLGFTFLFQQSGYNFFCSSANTLALPE